MREKSSNEVAWESLPLTIEADEEYSISEPNRDQVVQTEERSGICH